MCIILNNFLNQHFIEYIFLSKKSLYMPYVYNHVTLDELDKLLQDVDKLLQEYIEVIPRWGHHATT